MIPLVLIPTIFVLSVSGILYIGYNGPMNRVPRKSEMRVLVFICGILIILSGILAYSLLPYLNR